MHVTFNADCSPFTWFWSPLIEGKLTLCVNGYDCCAVGYDHSHHVIKFKHVDQDGNPRKDGFSVHADEVETVVIY